MYKFCLRTTYSLAPNCRLRVLSRARNVCWSSGRRNCQSLSRCAPSQFRNVAFYLCGSRFESRTWEVSRWKILSSALASNRSTIVSTSYKFYGHSLFYIVNRLWAGRLGYYGSIPCNDRRSHRIIFSVNLKTFSRRKVAGTWSWQLVSNQCSGWSWKELLILFSISLLNLVLK